MSFESRFSASSGVVSARSVAASSASSASRPPSVLAGSASGRAARVDEGEPQTELEDDEREDQEAEAGDGGQRE